jgi:hypothetical protein
MILSQTFEELHEHFSVSRRVGTSSCGKQSNADLENGVPEDNVDINSDDNNVSDNQHIIIHLLHNLLVLMRYRLV